MTGLARTPINVRYKTTLPTIAFRDFRNYAQHCELPVGRLTVTQTMQEAVIEVRHSVADLLRDYKAWKKSQLHKRSGEIDLLALLKEYNEILLGDFAQYVAAYFTRILLPLHNFAAQLAAEVKSIKPTYELVICTSAKGDAVTKVSFTCQHLPEDVLGFLNIRLVPVKRLKTGPPNA